MKTENKGSMFKRASEQVERLHDAAYDLLDVFKTTNDDEAFFRVKHMLRDMFPHSTICIDFDAGLITIGATTETRYRF